MSAFRCGTVALAGRPNTGKSSLLNRLVGQRLAIVSSKAQTTRHRLTGILTSGECQYLFVDLPGYQTRHASALNRALNRAASEGARDADVTLFVVEALRFGAADRAVLARIPQAQRVIAVVNKIDLAKQQPELLPFIAQLQRERDFAAIVPVSARTGRNLPELLRVVRDCLPEAPAAYPADQLTDRDERFFAAERLREKLFRLLGQELPYRCEVVIDSFKEEPRLRRIEATIWVERDSQKAIVIGAAGANLKRISSAARRDLEALFGGPVYLGVWVKVKQDWTRDARQVARVIRAYDPRPGAYATRKAQDVKLFGARLAPRPESAPPGEVLDASESGLVVSCGEGAVRILQVQPTGKKRMSSAEWHRGRGVAVGDRFDH